jgi:hypothetical protein
MKFLGGLSFATVTAIVSGVTAPVVPLLIFGVVWWRIIAALSLTAAFAYFFARWKLKRMNLAAIMQRFDGYAADASAHA